MVPGEVSFTETKSKMVIARAGERRIGSCCLMGTKFQFCRRRVLEIVLHNKVDVHSIELFT